MGQPLKLGPPVTRDEADRVGVGVNELAEQIQQTDVACDRRRLGEGPGRGVRRRRVTPARRQPSSPGSGRVRRRRLALVEDHLDRGRAPVEDEQPAARGAGRRPGGSPARGRPSDPASPVVGRRRIPARWRATVRSRPRTRVPSAAEDVATATAPRSRSTSTISSRTGRDGRVIEEVRVVDEDEQVGVVRPETDEPLGAVRAERLAPGHTRVRPRGGRDEDHGLCVQGRPGDGSQGSCRTAPWDRWREPRRSAGAGRACAGRG